CYRAPTIGRTLCDFEAGLIQGVMEELVGKNVTREIYCWGLSNSFCGFEVIFE
ncbi:V4R domain-containing protein, partial [Thermococcus sp.]